MKTYSPKPRDIERRWYLIDASGAVLGRLASEAAAILRGKHKPIFAPHMDTGDHVIVINAKDVRLTGGKEEKKVAYRHSGYPGGLTETTYSRLLAERPAYAVEKAIKGMLPKNRLGRAMATKLKVYAGAEHRHEAQRPQPLELGQIPRWEGLPAARPAPEPEAAPAEEKPAQTRRAPSPKSPAAKPTAAKRSAPKPAAAKETAAKRRAAKTGAKATAAKKAASAKKTTAKRTTAAKRPTARRSKKES
jgi:large subunit ribosomal protein L13